ncbi:WYL domain-containing protein [Phycicoccus endophyticus]|uniref:WYL domain-containing protein n=1 Tax=Phycicoccus endophyticus TaxID=1690220 RepID=A0A7G9R2D7_9MICO|nr:WYL domain-containing protein [Phycicoccus endophyticus]NHI20858.1 WYL domain-containing protein [Phycicoccus endophyticus]QNN49762.1 WYL domain-containing protein [Phycicoccus endophyticus]GGL34904.1 transcriptional regulator [Phycicoccus endophyticus]
MSSPAARVLRLLELLQSAQLRTVPELADHLEVDERTVRRWVQQLKELDIPVETVRGRYGGYRVGSGRRMPPLVLSDEEAVAVVGGLLRAQAAADAPDVAVQTALAKIGRLLPAESGRRVAALLATFPEAANPSAAQPDALDAGILLTLADAVASRSPLELRYRDAEGVPSRRTVHPYRLLPHTHRWYLVARDVGPGEERIFRVDRVRTARRLPGVVHGGVPERTVAQLLARFAEADYAWRVVLRVRASPARVRAHLPRSVATVTPAGPGWQRAEIRARRLDWLPALVVRLDAEVVVDEPSELRELLAAAADRLAAASTPPVAPSG